METLRPINLAVYIEGGLLTQVQTHAIEHISLAVLYRATTIDGLLNSSFQILHETNP